MADEHDWPEQDSEPADQAAVTLHAQPPGTTDGLTPYSRDYPSAPDAPGGTADPGTENTAGTEAGPATAHTPGPVHGPALADIRGETSGPDTTRVPEVTVDPDHEDTVVIPDAVETSVVPAIPDADEMTAPGIEQPGIEQPDTEQADTEQADDPELVDELMAAGSGVAPPPATPTRRLRRGVGVALMIAGGTLALLAVLYTADLLLSVGRVPRGVTVAGVAVGGMKRADAEQTLRRELEPRLIEPVIIRGGDVTTQLDPVTAGLGLDWHGTVQRAGSQPLSPLTRLWSFFTTREVGVVTSTRWPMLTRAVHELAESRLNHPMTEGGIGFTTIPGTDGEVSAFAIEPRQAQELTDVEGAARRIDEEWLGAPVVELPLSTTPPKVTLAGVHAALDRIVRPAVAEPVVVHGDGTDGVLRPRDVANALRFAPAGDGGLQVKVEQSPLREALAPQLAETERKGVNAKVVFTGDRPTVEPSTEGRVIDWARTLAPFFEVATRAEARELPVVYATRQPEVTTEEAHALGIHEVVGEFTTTGMVGEVAHNVAVLAEQVTGTIVRPGDTFSLDGHTGPRTASQGYVVAPLHEDGTGPLVIGGGVGQFTTTLYNAMYFAGLKDAGHTEHPYYFDRYPVGRDARSLDEDGSRVDMAFTNDAPTGVAIQAFADGGSVTVRIWGTKRYRVESATGERSGFEPPPVRRGPPDNCRPSLGTPGFTTSDTRVLYDLESGAEVRRETRSVRYGPKPMLVC
ncbi:Vancomycin resistance protein YoaR, contains peptidoglycan-binding and VanW domains [Amycolatopsis arida]|uniref:Vancomycin resistance protein YoaR, contains peptidoglycan-binding and VanW domains n=1 Tax=Amycolatopsis arida TaxID=587909 RepID=A0A1I5TJ22_9PSEU|nr:VanW family protein [Amycolatopsis arida]TDX96076.1 vancomycin resistance protein YoaR [Amycolatopsis arida]SFP83062.1 Vancomycin resistance protein YoaR, contains peptidoglycan-binding and VanW domains [Amycolatopsis arida]